MCTRIPTRLPAPRSGNDSITSPWPRSIGCPSLSWIKNAERVPTGRGDLVGMNTLVSSTNGRNVEKNSSAVAHRVTTRSWVPTEPVVAGATTQFGFYDGSLPFGEMRITVFPHMRGAIAVITTLTTFPLGLPLAGAETRLDLPALVSRARKNAQVEMARAGADGARAKRDEVSRA